MLSHTAKRTLDLAGAVSGIILLAPLMALVALAVKLRLGSPVLFRQVRPGQHGQPFTMYKFRTMLEVRDRTGQPLPDTQRLTPLGGFLRRTSMDELPELFNVLKGDMCLVGPRPLLMEYLERYTADQARRLEVKPGITGLAQVSGRNELTWEERFALDVQYVDHWDLSLDARILGLTLIKVLRQDGITAAGHSTMPEFQGRTELQ